ncbi:ABC transporter substrate-binding protein [Acidocella sp.]|uniref:ABC transporter substrate-binding protein n=1 Tax=Acidocella sp. TaxID=50710 RepID=UPI003CFC4228
MSRRGALKLGGLTVAGSLLDAPYVRAASSRKVKIGFVSPVTGPLAAFSQPDPFLLAQLKKSIAGGLKIGGQLYDVEILYKDSQSDSNRASDVTSDLILNDEVALVIAASTPATTVPVSSQCELNGVPCITTDTPWQSWFYGCQGNPKTGFQWTYHFFWGLEQLIGTFTSMWQQIPTDKAVGSLWPNDSDGNSWADVKTGFPPALAKDGFKLTDLGRFPLPVSDFTPFITAFKNNAVETVVGVLPPPDFATFWSQSAQQNFRPKIVTCPKALEFPQTIKAFGERANGLSVEVAWAPEFPFVSTLTGQSGRQLAKAYTAASGDQWSMPLGNRHALFEVAVDVLKRASSTDPKDIRAAIAATNLKTINGTVNFAQGPVPNVSETPLVSGQWRKAGNGFDLVIVDNAVAPEVPVADKLQSLA